MRGMLLRLSVKTYAGTNIRVAKREITAIRKEKAAMAEAKAKEAKN
jgi:hypothetical protein